MVFGIKTDTADKWGKVIEHKEVDVDFEKIKSVLKGFFGKEIAQVPPMYSALKYKGKKLYELARDGITVERKSRKVKIYSIKDLYIRKKTLEEAALLPRQLLPRGEQPPVADCLRGQPHPLRLPNASGEVALGEAVRADAPIIEHHNAPAHLMKV